MGGAQDRCCAPQLARLPIICLLAAVAESHFSELDREMSQRVGSAEELMDPCAGHLSSAEVNDSWLCSVISLT